MHFTKYLLPLIVISYGGLTIMAAAVQLKQKQVKLASSISMILGGLLLISALILNLFISHRVLILAAGLLIIQCAAISNGLMMFGRINPKHHAVRLGISVLILALSLID